MSKAVKLDAIGQIHISVRDLPRIVEFYRDILGMTFLFEVPGQSMAFFDCGGIRLYFGRPETEEFRSNPVIYYKVPSISDTCKSLLKRAVQLQSEPHIVHSTDTFDLWLADFRDPEGNVLVLMSEIAK